MLDEAAPAPEDDGIRLPLLIRTKIDRREHNLRLVRLLCKPETARAQLFADGEAAPRDLKLERLARLAFLAPDIVNAIMEGTSSASAHDAAHDAAAAHPARLA